MLRTMDIKQDVAEETAYQEKMDYLYRLALIKYRAGMDTTQEGMERELGSEVTADSENESTERLGD